jgi:hypothetical protein
LQGRVYSLVRSGQHQDKSHPNAVILQTSADSYLCVAGFSPGKPAVENLRLVESTRGVHADAFGIVVDHCAHLTPTRPNLTMQNCIYVSQTAEKMNAAQLQAGEEWGTLSGEAVKLIVKSVLCREEVIKELPRRTVKLLTNWLNAQA